MRPFDPPTPLLRLLPRSASVRAFGAALALISAIGVLPTAVRAQALPPAADPVSVAQARSLFEQGLAAADRREWSAAVDLFSRSMIVRPSPSVAFNLGLALIQLGRRAEARQHLVYSRDRSSDPMLRERARAEVVSIERTLGRLDVRLATPLIAAELRLDGHAISAPMPGQPLWVEPGGHVLAVVRDGRDVDWAAIEVPSGRAAIVSLDPGRAVPRPPRVDPSATDAPSSAAADPGADGDGRGDGAWVRRRSSRGEPARSSSLLQRWWFWTAIGVVVAGAATVTIVAATSGSEEPYRGNLGPGTFEIP